MRPVSRDRIGISTVHYRYYTFDSFLAMQRQTGLTKTDLLGAPPHCRIEAGDGSNAARLREAAGAQGMEIRSLTLETSSFRYTLGSEGEFLKETCRRLPLCLDFAAAAGADKILLQANGFRLDRDPAASKKQLEEMLSMILELAGERDLSVGLLPQCEDRTSLIRNLEDMRYWMDRMSDPRLFPAPDTACVYESGEDLSDWLLAFGGRIRHIRLSNTMMDGNRRAFGDGYLHLGDLLGELEAGGYTGELGLYYDLRKYWREPLFYDQQVLSLLRQAEEAETAPGKEAVRDAE